MKDMAEVNLGLLGLMVPIIDLVLIKEPYRKSKHKASIMYSQMTIVQHETKN